MQESKDPQVVSEPFRELCLRRQFEKRLQKLISQLEILRVSLSQEDINLKFFRSLPTEWRTHTLIWRNKTYLEKQSLDDLFNSLKINEAEVKRLKLIALSLDDWFPSVMVWAAMTGVFKQMRNLPTMLLWPSLLQVLLLIMRYQSGYGYHVVPPPYTGTSMPHTPNLVFYDAPNDVETDHTDFNVKLSPTKSDQGLSPTYRPSAPIIEDWVFYLEDDSETKTPQNAPSFVQPNEQVKPPRPSDQHVETSISTANPKTAIPKPTSNGNHRNRKECFISKSLTHLIKDCDYHAKKMAQPIGNPQHALKDKEVIDSGCSRHMIGNMSYLSDFEELNGRYVAFGRNPKGGKISRKGKIMTGNLDFDDVYFVKELKFNLFSVSQMCDKKNSVLFTDTECLVLSPEFKLPDENQVLLRGIKREFSIPRTPQQNGIAKRKNRALIEAAKTMLADSLLPIPFWAEAVNTACYVQNRVLVTKPHNKTPYELLHGRTPSISFIRPFGYCVTILNTLDSLGKFDGKVDEGFLVGYSVSSKAFRVFNSRTQIVQETLHINFLENKPNVAGSGPTWLFVIDTLIKTMNYQPVTVGNQSNLSAGVQEQFNAEKVGEEKPEFEGRKPESEVNVFLSSSAQSKKHDDKTKREKVWVLVDLPNRKRAIGTKWVFRNKNDERGIVVRNKTRLVSQGHTQEEGIDYEEVFAPVERIEVIRLFLAYASFMEFMVYQMDVKSAFLYRTIEEKVYVCQPLGFEDPDYPDKLLKDKFQMSSIGELTFFLGLQVKQKKDAIFISQDKYVAEILRKFGLTDGKSASTLIDTERPLLKDPNVQEANSCGHSSTEAEYVATASCCAQVLWIQNQLLDYGLTMQVVLSGVNTPRCDEDRLELMKLMVFLLPSDEKVGVEVSAVDLQVSADSEGFNQIIDFLNESSIKYALPVNPNIYVSCIKHFWTSVAVKKVNDVMRLQALVDKKKVIITKASIRDALRLDDADGIECLPSEEIITPLNLQQRSGIPLWGATS
nr:retrovirus-related Pol polyprotein from transposon TNT 1-94 [Tanacetum cinerariifolium]